MTCLLALLLAGCFDGKKPSDGDPGTFGEGEWEAGMVFTWDSLMEDIRVRMEVLEVRPDEVVVAFFQGPKDSDWPVREGVYTLDKSTWSLTKQRWHCPVSGACTTEPQAPPTIPLIELPTDYPGLETFTYGGVEFVREIGGARDFPRGNGPRGPTTHSTSPIFIEAMDTPASAVVALWLDHDGFPFILNIDADATERIGPPGSVSPLLSSGSIGLSGFARNGENMMPWSGLPDPKKPPLGQVQCPRLDDLALQRTSVGPLVRSYVGSESRIRMHTAIHRDLASSGPWTVEWYVQTPDGNVTAYEAMQELRVPVNQQGYHHAYVRISNGEAGCELWDSISWGTYAYWNHLWECDGAAMLETCRYDLATPGLDFVSVGLDPIASPGLPGQYTARLVDAEGVIIDHITYTSDPTMQDPLPEVGFGSEDLRGYVEPFHIEVEGTGRVEWIQLSFFGGASRHVEPGTPSDIAKQVPGRPVIIEDGPGEDAVLDPMLSQGNLWADFNWTTDGDWVPKILEYHTMDRDAEYLFDIVDGNGNTVRPVTVDERTWKPLPPGGYIVQARDPSLDLPPLHQAAVDFHDRIWSFFDCPTQQVVCETNLLLVPEDAVFLQGSWGFNAALPTTPDFNYPGKLTIATPDGEILWQRDSGHRAGASTMGLAGQVDLRGLEGQRLIARWDSSAVPGQWQDVGTTGSEVHFDPYAQ